MREEEPLTDPDQLDRIRADLDLVPPPTGIARYGLR